MNSNIQSAIAQPIREFHLPRYEDIPNVGLYLEQTTRYIAELLAPLHNVSITGSMISNYVKKGLISNPVKKQYDREQIAYLIFIAVAKSVLSLEDIQLMIRLQQQTYESKVAYEYFCRELEDVLYVVFGLKDKLEEVSTRNTEEKTMLRNAIITAAHKVYLDMWLAAVRPLVTGETKES